LRCAPLCALQAALHWRAAWWIMQGSPQHELVRFSLPAGAIMIGLKNPTVYKSITAFAPICNASAVPMGQKGAPLSSASRPRAHLWDLDSGVTLSFRNH